MRTTKPILTSPLLGQFLLVLRSLELDQLLSNNNSFIPVSCNICLLSPSEYPLSFSYLYFNIVLCFNVLSHVKLFKQSRYFLKQHFKVPVTQYFYIHIFEQQNYIKFLCKKICIIIMKLAFSNFAFLKLKCSSIQTRAASLTHIYNGDCGASFFSLRSEASVTQCLPTPLTFLYSLLRNQIWKNLYW